MKSKMSLFSALAVLVVSFAMTETAGAQAAPQPTAIAPVASTSTVAVPAGTQVVAPAAVSLAPSQPAVVVPANTAPPTWATELLSTIAGLPVVGPYVSQILLWLGILAAILTTLVAAALSILASLKGAFKWAGLDSAVAAITAFQAGPVMYYLKYFSNFNAQKSPPPTA